MSASTCGFCRAEAHVSEWPSDKPENSVQYEYCCPDIECAGGIMYLNLNDWNKLCAAVFEVRNAATHNRAVRELDDCEA